MRRALFVLLALALPVAACGKKGLPPECDAYLVRYDCFLTKSGMAAADKQKTLDGMRSTWVTASNNPTGRNAVLGACKQMEASMASQLATSGCK